jgi:hypothetical protein
MIGVLTMIAVCSAATAMLGGIRPARTSLDDGAAMAAAQAGIEDFLSWVNTNCPPTQGYACSSLVTGTNNKQGISDTANQQGVRVTGADGTTATNESFYWNVSYASSGFARLTSVGQIPTGLPSPKYRTKTLVADINAVPSFTNFQYYTKYETYAPDFLDSFYGPRTIELTPSADFSNTVLPSTTPKPGRLTWSGVCTYDATTNAACDQNHDTGICNDLYYPSSAGLGRSSDTAWNNTFRRPPPAVQSRLVTDNTFAYYSEPGSYKPTGSPTPTAVTHDDVCDSSFQPNMNMNGPIYSQDAYLVDRGKATGSSCQSMPNFNDFAYSLWNGQINGVQQAPQPTNGGWDRAYPGTDGQACVTSNKKPFPTYTTNKLDLPADTSGAKPLQTCTYTGPTRVLIKQNFAYVTSPGTAAGAAPCFQSTGSYVNANTLDSANQRTTDASGGVIEAKVPINNTMIYIQNSAPSVTPTAATSTSPVFKLSSNLTVPPASTTDGLAGQWPTAVTYPASVNCPLSPPDPSTQRNFDCETGRTANPKSNENVLANIKSHVDAVLAAASPTATLISDAITSQMNTASLIAPTTVGGVYYTVSVTPPSPTPTVSTVTPPALTPADPFLQQRTGSGYKTTTSAWSASITRKVCTTVSKGACSYTSTAIVQGALSTSTSAAIGSPVNSQANFPWFDDGSCTGTGTETAACRDVTQYNHGYGDAYVEGTLQGGMSIVSEHDIVLTNDLIYKNGASNPTDGLAVVAKHDVRIYRPMTCAHAGTGLTSAGSCPDDLTGIFSAPLSWPLPSNLPSSLYTPSSAPSMTNGGSGTIDATIFALRGSLMADNFYRGDVGSTVTVTGGLYQYHRGPTSLPFQGRPFQGSRNKMPGILLTYNYDNMRAGQAANGGLRVPWIPTPSGRLSTNTWNVISISTGS